MEAVKQEANEIIPVLLPPGTDDAIRDSHSTLQIAELMTVDDAESYEYAGLCIIEWKDKIKKRQEFFRPLKQAMDAAKRVILDKEDEAVGPLEKAWRTLQTKALKWKSEQERRAAEERRRLEEQARKEEEERRLAEASRLELNGEKELAQEIIAEPIEVPRVVVPPAVPKVKGLTPTKRWTFRITDQSKVNRLYLMPDEKKIRKQVEAMGKDAETLVGGIEAYQEEIFTRR